MKLGEGWYVPMRHSQRAWARSVVLLRAGFRNDHNAIIERPSPMARLTAAGGAPPAEHTFSLMTYNLWKIAGVPTFWGTRRGVLLRQLRVLSPDVLLCQEICPEIATCIKEALPNHVSVGATVPFHGFQHEGDIFYRKDMFAEAVEAGYEDIGQEETWRRLFFARLRFTGSRQTVLFSTAHFTWQGHVKECETNLNLRKLQAKHTVTALDKLQGTDEACFFGGDLNESFWPKRILEQARFVDCFTALSLPCRPTHPHRPTLSHEDQNADAALDWLFARKNGRVTLQPMCATVVRDMKGLSSDDPMEKNVLTVCPSDHCPVLAVYRLGASAE